ncbi:MAG: ABC transporter permease [Acidobacteriota bacterium]
MAFDHLRQDLRSAARNLVRAPGFAVVTILTLGLGIGANTAIFSIVNAAILRPLPYPRADQLMFVTSRFPNMGFDQFWVSPPEYFELTEINDMFAVVGAFTTSEVNLAALDRPRRVRSGAVNGELLETLAVPAARGRWFTRAETRANGPRLAILSHEIWQSAFAGREDIVGQMVDVDGVRREVVGVMPAGFDVMDNRVEVWLPLQLDPTNRRNRGSHYLYLIGRLKDDRSEERAQAELATLVKTWGERVGVKQHVFSDDGHALQMEPVQEEIVGSARRAIWVLQGAVAFVLLIACANLANLLLARAESRRREFGVRTALGAGRGRLLAQFVTEGTLLSLLGAGVGLVLAGAGVSALVTAFPDSLPRSVEITLDRSVLGFTLLVAVATGLVFGLAPLGHLSATSLTRSLKEGGARGATGGRFAVRRSLVIAEVALAVVLVAGAGLMVRTVMNLLDVDAGFDRSRLVTFALDVPSATYAQPSQIRDFYSRLLTSLSSVPGVQRVAAMSGLPPQRRVDANDTDIDGYTAPPEGPFENVDYYNYVTAGYFDTMGIPIVEGRAFEEADGRPFNASDPDVAPAVIINETMARTFWPDRSAIGRRVRPSFGSDTPWLTIIGVAKDVKQGGLDQKTGTELYFLNDVLASLNFYPANLHLIVRSTLPLETLAPSLESTVREADGTLPIIKLRPMDAVFSEALSRPRLLANLLGGFAGLALVLAALGTYGVLSFMVSERRREIGIRMALGAERATVLRSVLRQGLGLAAAGLIAGLAGAAGLTRLMESLLYEVRPTDAATLAAVALAILLTAAVAAFVPARRATRVDPVVVLRDE